MRFWSIFIPYAGFNKPLQDCPRLSHMPALTSSTEALQDCPRLEHLVPAFRHMPALTSSTGLSEAGAP